MTPRAWQAEPGTVREWPDVPVGGTFPVWLVYEPGGGPSDAGPLLYALDHEPHAPPRWKATGVDLCVREGVAILTKDGPVLVGSESDGVLDVRCQVLGG